MHPSIASTRLWAQLAAPPSADRQTILQPQPTEAFAVPGGVKFASPPNESDGAVVGYICACMATHSDNAIVLRLYDYSESSQIAALLTAERGIVRLLAKGTKRATKSRVSVGLDLLEWGDVSYSESRGGGMGNLHEWMQRDAFAGLRRSLAATCAGLTAVENTQMMMEEADPHRDVFDALLELLRELDGAALAGGDTTRVAAGLVRFQAELLKSTGFAPMLRECVNCGAPRVRGTRAWFSSRAGGMLCENCYARHPEKRPIPPALLDSPRGTTNPRDWVQLLNYHISMVAGREVRSAPALMQSLHARPAGAKAGSAQMANGTSNQPPESGEALGPT